MSLLVKPDDEFLLGWTGEPVHIVAQVVTGDLEPHVGSRGALERSPGQLLADSLAPQLVRYLRVIQLNHGLVVLVAVAAAAAQVELVRLATLDGSVIDASHLIVAQIQYESIALFVVPD